VALRRARHQQVDRPLVLDDPIVPRLVDLESSAASESEADRRLRAFVVARSRFAEDLVADVHGRGVRQYVVLGAGLDTFAYRNPWSELRVFEVDVPATQTWKRIRLRAASVPEPPLLTFVPVHFETDTLADGLARSGFDATQPAMFSWLGVVPYLTPDAVRRTLAFVGSLPPSTAIAFDYTPDPSTMTPARRAAFDALAARVAAAGEPFRSAFDPVELDCELRRSGFTRTDDWDTDRINGLYFANRADGLRTGGAGRLMRAYV
jgi:methyltransferase (TIGR00027 family)